MLDEAVSELSRGDVQQAGLQLSQRGIQHAIQPGLARVFVVVQAVLLPRLQPQITQVSPTPNLCNRRNLRLLVPLPLRTAK